MYCPPGSRALARIIKYLGSESRKKVVGAEPRDRVCSEKVGGGSEGRSEAPRVGRAGRARRKSGGGGEGERDVGEEGRAYIGESRESIPAR